MCQLGITPIPTSYTASSDSGRGGVGFEILRTKNTIKKAEKNEEKMKNIISYLAGKLRMQCCLMKTDSLENFCASFDK